MAIKKYHVSQNLFDKSTARSTSYATVTQIDNGLRLSGIFYVEFDFSANIGDIIYMSWRATIISGSPSTRITFKYRDGTFSPTTYNGGNVTITKEIDIGYLYISGADSAEVELHDIMLNTGSQPLPYEPYSSEVWHTIPYRKYGTETDTITTLPKTIIGDGQSASAVIKGNMQQSGTPTPQNPIYPQETGDLETEGAKAGQYKIPISSASTTTPVYLGEVESTRKIKKIKASDITWIDGSTTGYNFYRGNLTIPKLAGGGISTLLSNKYRSVETRNNLSDGDIASYNITTIETIVIRDDRYSSAADWLSANGDTEIWYVLAEPTTGIVNEPLMKIGDYADEVLGITIPTIAGANTLSIGTTLQPSEVSVNYHGWHPVADVHEKSRNLFDYNAYFDSVFTPYNQFFEYSSIQLVPNTTYTLSTSIAEYGTNPRNTAFIVATTNQTPTTTSGGISNISPITITTENDGILRLYKRISGNGILPTKDLFDAGDWLMLNTGSTALPYEPYWT